MGRKGNTAMRKRASKGNRIAAEALSYWQTVLEVARAQGARDVAAKARRRIAALNGGN